MPCPLTDSRNLRSALPSHPKTGWALMRQRSQVASGVADGPCPLGTSRTVACKRAIARVPRGSGKHYLHELPELAGRRNLLRVFTIPASEESRDVVDVAYHSAYCAEELRSLHGAAASRPVGCRLPHSEGAPLPRRVSCAASTHPLAHLFTDQAAAADHAAPASQRTPVGRQKALAPRVLPWSPANSAGAAHSRSRPWPRERRGSSRRG